MPGDVDSCSLMQDARRGSTAALQSLVVRHLPFLQAFVRLRAGKLVRAKADTVDLVQSVCCDVLANPSDFEYQGETAFRNWLGKRVLHKVINTNRHHRAQKRDVGREVAPSESDSASPSYLSCYATLCTPSRVAMGHEAVERLESAFDELKDEYKEAITLYRIVGLSYPEIAAEMGRSEGAVRNLVYRGLARLSGLLEDAS